MAEQEDGVSLLRTGAGRTTVGEMDTETIPQTDESLRAAMVGRLWELEAIRRAEVAAAFLRVPRHVFAPEATLEEAYEAETVVRTKWAADGTAISSVSAPQIQAQMVEQAGITRGMRVLEVGSGVTTPR